MPDLRVQRSGSLSLSTAVIPAAAFTWLSTVSKSTENSFMIVRTAARINSLVRVLDDAFFFLAGDLRLRLFFAVVDANGFFFRIDRDEFVAIPLNAIFRFGTSSCAEDIKNTC